MRRFVFVFLLLLLSSASYGAFSPIAKDATADNVLDALHSRGDDLRDFSADVTMTAVDQTTGDSSAQIGEVLFQQLGDSDGRIRVNFTQRTAGDRVFQEHHEYVLSGGWLVDRDYEKKTELRRQVLRPGQKMNLLKLGEGPFPLPVGQKKEDVYKEFDVTLAPADKADPPDTAHLTLKPKAKTDMAQRFSQVDVWVDRQLGMPARIVTLNSNGEQSVQTDFSKPKLNVGLGDGDFALPVVQGWDTTDEPFKQ